MAAKKTKSKNYIFSVGRRKNAAARVRLYRGKGESTVNGILIRDYFPGAVSEEVYTRPFKLVDVRDKYYVTVRVVGGGKSGQLDAVVNGIAKALNKVSEDFRKPLKSAGLLTRDDRKRERRKPGTGGRARKQKQSPKR